MAGRAERNAVFERGVGVASLPAIRYVILSPGKRDARRPDPADEVRVSTEGSFADGEIFVALDMKQAVMKFSPAVAMSLMQMREGEVRLVYIPAALFLGPNGNIYTGQRDVIFRISLNEVRDPVAADR